MKRKISPRFKRRSLPNAEIKYEAGSDRLTDFNADNDSDSNIQYTSTPLQNINDSRIRRQFSAPNFDSRSEESTDAAIRAKTKPLKRRKTARSLKKERIPSAKKIADGEEDRREKRRRRSRRRRSGGGKNNIEDEKEDDFERFRKEKKAHRQDEEEEEEAGELPIADLLRKAQGNQRSLQTRYEDPIPLPELTTDTLYVQGRNGFNAVKIGNFRSERNSTERLSKPIHIAIKIHSLSKTVMLFCQGLLGGIALSQVILVTKVETDSNVLAQINSTSYPHLVSGIFLFLVTMSLLAAMDRIDMANLDLDNIREIFTYRLMTIVTFPIYLVAICIHLSVINIDRKLATVGQESAVVSNAVEHEEHTALQRQTHTWKFVLCVIAWFFVALGPTEDLTTTNLEAMLKYAT